MDTCASKNPISTITVYCGSSLGKRTEYGVAAEGLGKEMLKHNIGLVYGSGKEGMMGVISKTISDGGGKVTGIIPTLFFDNFTPHYGGSVEMGYGETIVVDSMHIRKQMMCDRADAFIAMPGGVGTMEEIVEMITWSNLKLHKKPLGLLNVCNYFDGFMQWYNHAVKEGFIQEIHSNLVIVESNPALLIEKIIERANKKPHDKSS